MRSVALVGPDGSGKTTVARQVVAELPGVAYLYAGTNPDMGARMLPTTKLAVLLRGGVSHGRPAATRPSSFRGSAVSWLRTLVWLTEELARGRQARRLARSARLVLRDRDFLVDRLAAGGPQPLYEQFHRWALARWYPRPDRTIVLDVPGAVAFERKREVTVEELERRREGYLALRHVLPLVSVVDAGRPTEDVVDAVVEILLRDLAEPGARS